MTAEAQTIPEDIKRDARNALQVAKNRRHPVASIVPDELIVEAISEALMYERQRCAAIVENFASGRGISTEAVKARKLPSQTSILMGQLIRGEV